MFENKKIQNLFLNEEKVEDLIRRYYSDIYKYCFFILGIEKQQRIINVNIKMYIFDHLRMYIFAILPLDRYIFLSDKIFL